MRWTFGTLLCFSLATHAFQFGEDFKSDYFDRNGNAKALEHLECIMKMTKHETFRIRESTRLKSRCSEVEAGGRQISVNNHKWAAIVDYTKTSDQRRFYLFNLDGSKKHRVVSFYVSHGRNGKTKRSNTKPGPGKNTVREIKYFSNVPGSNASSSGFFITGHSYLGSRNGPSKKELSMALHGLEQGVNDNVCDRAVVMHGSSGINESGKNKGVSRMSSGCLMVDWNWVTELAERLRGSEESTINKQGGIPFLIYGPREASLPSDYYCTKQAANTVMFD